MIAHPCRGAACPSVAEAVAEADVAVCTETAMDIVLALGHELVDACGILGPFQVEVFPESRGSHVEHASPELADDVHRLGIPAVHSEGLKHIVTVEGGESLRSSHGHIVAASLGRVHQPGYRHQGGSLLEVVWFLHLQP